MKTRRNNCNYTHTRCKQSQHASSGLMIRGWLAWGRQILREEVGNDRGKIGRKQFSLGGGCLRTRAKWSFSQCQTIVKMISSERAQRDENVGVGFTSIGVTGKKIRTFKTQGLIYKNKTMNRSLSQN